MIYYNALLLITSSMLLLITSSMLPICFLSSLFDAFLVDYVRWKQGLNWLWLTCMALWMLPTTISTNRNVSESMFQFWIMVSTTVWQLSMVSCAFIGLIKNMFVLHHQLHKKQLLRYFITRTHILYYRRYYHGVSSCIVIHYAWCIYYCFGSACSTRS